MEYSFTKTLRRLGFSIRTGVTALVLASLSFTADAQQMSGTYTINSNGSASASNFLNYTSAVQALRGVTRSDGGPSFSGGVSGAVTFNVTSSGSAYNERVVIPAITGASATNRITFNGNGQEVNFNTQSTTDIAVFELNGADFITLSNIRIRTTNSNYGYGVWLYNRADENIVQNCDINISASTSTTNGWASGIAMVGSAGCATCYTTGGIKGINNIFRGNTIYGATNNNGMVSGIIINGGSSPNDDNIVVENNTITNFYLYGIYNYYYSGNTIYRNNTIVRGMKSTITTFYGIYTYMSSSQKFYDNFIWDGAPTTSTYTFTGYGIYDYYGTNIGMGVNDYVNNIIKFTNGWYLFGIYGLNYYATAKNFLHNTLYFDVPGMIYAYGIYNSEYNYAPVRILNNIVDIRATNLSSTTYNIYNYSYSAAVINGNVLPRTASTWHYTGYHYTLAGGGGQHLEWSDWRANPNNPDVNGQPTRPSYANAAANNFSPTSIALDGAGVNSGVALDRNKQARNSTNPDPGAIEFDLPLNVNSITYPSQICQGTPANVQVSIQNNSAFNLSGFRVQYTINNGTPVIENYTATINAGASATFTFPTPIQNSTAGNFTIRANVLGKPVVATANYTVNPSPVGSLATQGSVFQGSFNSGDAIDPDIVAHGDNIRYSISAPTGYTNGQYNAGTGWVFDYITLRTTGGTNAGTAFTVTNPSASGAGVASFTPVVGHSDSTFILRYAIRSVANGCVAPEISRRIFVAPRPNVNFTTIAACEGDKVLFQNGSSVSSGSVDYKWQFGNGDSSVLINPEYNYGVAGTYNVTLRATTNYGYTAVATGTATVFRNPTADFAFSNQCEGMPVPFTDASIIPQGTPSYVWEFGDGGATSTSNNPSRLYTTPGTYEVLMKVTANGCSDEKRAYVTVSPRASVDFTANNVNCSNDPISFSNGTTLNNGTVGYSWDFGNGVKSSEVNPTYQYASGGSYTVTLEATTNFGCTDRKTTQISVASAPTVNFNTQNICSRDNVVLTNTTVEPTGFITAYEWKVSDGAVSTAKDLSKAFAATGEYLVTLKAVATNGCSNEVSKTVSVDENPVADFYVDDVCQGAEVKVMNASYGNNGRLNYSWSLGSTSTSIDRNPTIVLPVGTHDIKLDLTTPSGCADSKTLQVRVKETPSVTITVSSGEKGDGSIAVVGNGTANANYSVYFGDGGRASGSTGSGSFNEIYRYIADGLFQVSVRVSKDGCSSETAGNASVYRTSVNNLEAGNLNIYPNPTSGVFYIAFDKAIGSTTQVEVYTMAGQLVSVKSFDGLQTSFELDASELASGMYQVRLVNGNDLKVGKIQVIK